MITEVGIADKEDKARSDFLKDSVKAMVKAIEEGVDVDSFDF